MTDPCKDSGRSQEAHPIVIRVLAEEDGDGWITFFQDFPGDMSHGATPAEAAAKWQDALRSWLEVAEELGQPVPAPAAALWTELPRAAGVR